MDDRVRDARIPNQVFLGLLGPEVSAIGKPIGPDDRQDHMVADVRSFLGLEYAAGRSFEELPHRRVLERGRVRDVDDGFGAVEGSVEARPRHGVDTRAGGSGDGLVSLVGQYGNDFGAYQPRADQQADLQDVPFLSGPAAQLLRKVSRSPLIWS